MRMATASTRDVGRIMVSFARLEWSLAAAISGLLGPDLPAGKMLALELPFVKKCALLSRLCQQKLASAPRKARAELEALIQQLLQCESSRNQVTHPLWLGPPRDWRGKRMRTARLKTVAAEVANTEDCFSAFMRAHFGNGDIREARKARAALKTPHSRNEEME